MKKDSNFVTSTIRYRKLIYFLVGVMVAFGIYSLFAINKDEFPTFQIKDGLVVGVYPGANAQEVEEQLTRPLEEILFKFAEVKRTTYSYTQDGICYIFVKLQCPAKQKNEVWSKIKLKLNASRIFLPSGVLTVQVMDEFSAVSSVLLALQSDDKSYRELEEYADLLKNELYTIPALSNIKILGTQK